MREHIVTISLILLVAFLRVLVCGTTTRPS